MPCLNSLCLAVFPPPLPLLSCAEPFMNPAKHLVSIPYFRMQIPMLEHSGTKTDCSSYLYKARKRCKPLTSTSVIFLVPENLGHHGIPPVVFLFQSPVGQKKAGLGELMASWYAGNWPHWGSQLIGEFRWLGLPWIKLLKRLLKCKYYGERIK